MTLSFRNAFPHLKDGEANERRLSWVRDFFPPPFFLFLNFKSQAPSCPRPRCPRRRCGGRPGGRGGGSGPRPLPSPPRSPGRAAGRAEGERQPERREWRRRQRGPLPGRYLCELGRAGREGGGGAGGGGPAGAAGGAAGAGRCLAGAPRCCCSGGACGLFPRSGVKMDLEDDFVSLLFTNRNLEDAALVGRGPGSDPAGAFGGRSSPLQVDWPPEFQLDGWRHTGGITFGTCSSRLDQPHRAGRSAGFLAPFSSCSGPTRRAGTAWCGVAGGTGCVLLQLSQ